MDDSAENDRYGDMAYQTAIHRSARVSTSEKLLCFAQGRPSAELRMNDI